jgi:hypothetical protein
MRNTRLMLVVAVILGFAFFLPMKGFAGREDPRTTTKQPRAGYFHYSKQSSRADKPGKPVKPGTPATPFLEKIDCRWTCRDGSSHKATTETVADCFDACAADCGNPCGWAE